MANQSLGTIREFETENFRVVVDAVVENDLDLSWDTDGSQTEQLENGNLIAFVARVRVFFQGEEIGSDYLGNCIYKCLDDFQDHRECGKQNRRMIKQQGRFQIYRKARPYEHCLSASDKLKKRGLSTREKAEEWAQQNATEPWQVFETGKCGSQFAGMISQAINEAREHLISAHSVRVRKTVK